MKQRHVMNILFPCTGSYYRIRFAEVLFNSIAGKMNLPWKTFSRGLALERGVNNVGPMAVEAIKALEARGLCAVVACGRFPIPVTLGDDVMWNGSWESFDLPPGACAMELTALDREGKVVTTRTEKFLQGNPVVVK